MPAFTYARSAMRYRKLRFAGMFAGAILFQLAGGLARPMPGAEHPAISTILVIAVAGLALMELASWYPRAPSADADPNSVVRVSWNADGLTVPYGENAGTYPWRLIGRIDLYSFSTPNARQAHVGHSLLIEVFKDGQLRQLIFAPRSLNMGDRTMQNVINEMNNLHERALLGAKTRAA